AVAISGLEVAGVVPPFGSVLGMVEVVARKFVAIAGQRLLILCDRRAGEQSHRDGGDEATPHAPPRSGLKTLPPSPDRSPQARWRHRPGSARPAALPQASGSESSS